MKIPPEGLFGDAALREAAAGSYQDIIRRVEGAVRALFKQSGQNVYVYLRGLWPDQAVFSVSQDNGDAKLLSYPYTLKADGSVTLGQPTEVVETFTPVNATMTEAAGALIEAAADAEGDPPASRFKVRVIRAGLSGNGNYYPDTTLREAVKLFNGARVFVKSDQEHLAGKGKDVRNLIGRLSDAAFVEGKGADTGEIQATLTLLSPSDPFSVKLREAVKGGQQDVFGLSIDADGKAKAGKAGGRSIQTATAITKVRSVDLIVEPGAGGGVISLIEALNEDPDMALRQTLIDTIQAKRPQLLAGKDVAKLSDNDLQAIFTEALAEPAQVADTGPKAATMDEVTKLIEAVNQKNARVNAARDRINATKLPATAKARLIKEFEATDVVFTEATVDARIKEEVAYLAPFAASGRVTGLGETALVESMEDRRAKLGDMLDAFFDPAHKDHASARSFKECYIEITGDRRVTGQKRDCDEARLREALGSDTFDAVLGDGIRRRMIAEYRGQANLDCWRMLTGTPVPISDFRTNERTRWGGYGDLPKVAENDPYLELASPDDDDAATYKVEKRGGTERISMEMIRNDDVGVIRRIPVQLGRAAKRTLCKFVCDFIRTNPTIFDGKALFHADHGNLGTTALDASAWAAARLAMVKQTEFGQSGETLGVGPKNLWIPPDLEEAAYNLFQRSTNNDKTFVQTLVPTIIPVWYWTDANDWACSADPLDIPTVEIGFLDGNEEPDLFIQDSPTSGSLFSNDSITYKVRHVYGGTVLDYRGMRKHVVA